jgi:excisionase family DNA binding protein
LEKYYNLGEVANLTGYKPRTLRAWIKNGKMKAKKMPDGRLWLVKEKELRRIMKNV